MTATPRERWLRGACPCCGSDLDWHWRDPEPVAEGVTYCGRCIENEHHLRGDVLPAVLRAIVTGEEFRDPEYAVG